MLCVVSQLDTSRDLSWSGIMDYISFFSSIIPLVPRDKCNIDKALYELSLWSAVLKPCKFKMCLYSPGQNGNCVDEYLEAILRFSDSKMCFWSPGSLCEFMP